MRNKKSLLSLALAAMMAFSPIAGAFADRNVATSDVVTEHEINSAKISLQMATEGMVLLENDGVLPLANTNVALYGIAAVDPIKGGTGSGAVNNRIVYPDGSKVDGVAIASSPLDGFNNAGYTVVNADYLQGLKDQYVQASTGGMGWGRGVTADPVVTYAQAAKDAEKTDTAIYIVRRNAGEGSDRTAANYNLTDIELGNIQMLSAMFDKCIVVLNVVSIASAWYAESGADALLLMSNPGMLSGDALVQILDGTVSPSGKLVDTWANSIDAYPSTEYFAAINEDDPWSSYVEYYAEGIYNGYRYFDTFAADKVVYEFGYGLSYTDFDIATDSVEIVDGDVVVTATVKNTGDTYSGKEVVEVYFSAPAVELDKPYQELVAFGKTDTLAPGQSQTLTITFPANEMSSYDEAKAAYVMEAGDYIIRVGNSSRNTTPAAVIALAETVVTEQLTNQATPDQWSPLVGGPNGRSTPPYTERIEGISVEQNLENLNTLVAEFEAANASGIAYTDGKTTENAIKITLDKAVVENTTPVYPELAEGETDEDVNEYISATTENIDVNGYNYMTGVDYNVNKIYFDADGNATTEKPAEMKNFRVKSGSEEDGTAEFYTLKDVYDGVLTMEQFVSGMTVEELANFVEGGNKSRNANGQSAGGASPSTYDLSLETQAKIDDVWVRGGAGETCGLYYDSRLIPNTTNADGPAGLRVDQTYTWEGEQYYQFCTAYPVGNMIAQSWDVDVARQMGAAVGADMLRAGVTMWLAPGMNIHRNPLCGRNFEYYSEDPLITGMMAGSEAVGLQSNGGIGVTFKHFAANNQETSRNSSNSVMSERALREIYLKGFEVAVKMSKPMGIMASYNTINNVSASNNYDILENILRKEWGFDGLVMTDWGGSGGYSDARAMHAGNDIIMAGKPVSNITGYIYDATPAIQFNEEGIATDGGYPFVVLSTRASGTTVTYTATTHWGDYTLSADGNDYVVTTTKEAFETETRPVRMYIDANGTYSTTSQRGVSYTQEAVDWTIAELFNGKVVNGQEIPAQLSADTASYVEDGDKIVITYKLAKLSARDNISTGNQTPTTTDIFGNPDENTLTLGDLQKSVIRILNMVMSSTQFADLIGVEAESYTLSRADQLQNAIEVVKGEVK